MSATDQRAARASFAVGHGSDASVEVLVCGSQACEHDALGCHAQRLDRRLQACQRGHHLVELTLDAIQSLEDDGEARDRDPDVRNAGDSADSRDQLQRLERGPNLNQVLRRLQQ